MQQFISVFIFTMPGRIVKRGKSSSSRWKCFRSACKDCWETFGETSSIHGIRYLSESGSSGVQKFTWGVILLVSSVIVSVFVYYLWLRYMESPTKTTIRSQHIPASTVPFPAITICPSSMIPKDKVDYFLNSHWKNTGTEFNQSIASEKIYRAVFQVGAGLDRSIAAPEDMEFLENFLKINRVDFLEFVNNVSLPCKDLFLKCRWNYEFVECHKIFSDLLTANGYCCSFNFHMGLKRSAYSKGFGLFSGLDIISNFVPFNEYGENIFRIYIHNGLTFPTNTINSFLAAEKKETAVAINMGFISSDQSLRKLSPKNRQCVFQDEYNLNYFSSYTFENCMSECQIKRFVEICHCVPHYLKPITRETIPFCTPTKYLCIAKHFQQVLNIQATEKFSEACSCPLECNLLMIDARLLEWNFHLGNLSVDTFYSGDLIDGSILHIFFARSCTLEYTKFPALQGLNFAANLGGLISLFLGCSFISVFEFFFYFCHRLPRLYRQMLADSNVLFMTDFYMKFFKVYKN